MPLPVAFLSIVWFSASLPDILFSPGPGNLLFHCRCNGGSHRAVLHRGFEQGSLACIGGMWYGDMEFQGGDAVAPFLVPGINADADGVDAAPATQVIHHAGHATGYGGGQQLGGGGLFAVSTQSSAYIGGEFCLTLRKAGAAAECSFCESRGCVVAHISGVLSILLLGMLLN